ncbi:MAG: glycosyltransferase family 4 protein [Victivallales bacterium]|nr:glycosyltransferase family 4 protein [Victivallales bacterium]
MLQKLNILLVDCAPFTGGAQESFWSLASGLSHTDCKPFLLAADHSPNGIISRAQASSLPHQSFTARHWPASIKGLFQYYQDRRHFLPLFDQTAADFSPALIHANCIRSALLLPEDCSLPLLLHDRDITFPFFFTRLVANRFPQLHIVAISPLVAKKWQPLLPEDRIHIIPNGFDLQTITNTRPSVNHDSTSFRILQVADFSPWKRHDRFLTLLSQLKPQIPNLKAVIKGRIRDAQGEHLLTSLKNESSKLGLDNILSFNTADESALPEIAAADVVVSCSDGEPFGRTIIEALALGKPVVACRGGGIDALLAECPAYSAVQPEKLQETVLQWLPPEKRCSAAEHAIHAAQTFSIERHIAEIIGIYKNIAYVNNDMLSIN